MLILVVEGKRTMRARFKGFCGECRKATYPGQEIRKAENGRWVHQVCPADYEPARQVGDGYREMAARFDSRCPTCNGAIAQGDRIIWRKGEKAVHAACFGEQVPAHPLAPLPERPAPAPAPTTQELAQTMRAARQAEQAGVRRIDAIIEAARKLERPRRRDPDMALAAENYGDPDDVDRSF